MDPFPAVRSILFVPGSRPELFPKAAKSGADALVLDLEDAVAASAKDDARSAVTKMLAQAAERLNFVRINHPSLGALDADLAVLAAHPRQAIMAPKVAGPQDIEPILARLAERERELGLPADAISLVVVIETALGLRNLFDTLMSAPRVRGAALATAEEGDLMLDLGGQWTAEGHALAYARGKFVCDSRACGMQWLIDGAFMNLDDDVALDRECRLARSYGFTSKVAIHPRQTAGINLAFSPSETEVQRAQRLIAAFRAAEADGHGAIRFEGMMVDYANVRRAEHILALAHPPAL